MRLSPLRVIHKITKNDPRAAYLKPSTMLCLHAYLIHLYNSPRYYAYHFTDEKTAPEKRGDLAQVAKAEITTWTLTQGRMGPELST